MKKPPKKLLEGHEEGIKGQTLFYEHGKCISNHNTMSIKDISKFVGCTYADGGDLHLSIKSRDSTTIPFPTDSTEGDPSVITLVLYALHSTIISLGSWIRILQENCVHKNSTRHRKREQYKGHTV